MARDERTYIRLHDGMPDHPKVDGLSDRAFRLLVESWCWCSRHLTDGHIPATTWTKRGTPKARGELVMAGLVELTETGVQMHDYLQHQRSAVEVAEIKDSRSEAGTRGNHLRWHVGPEGRPRPGCPLCRSRTTDRKRDPKSDRKTDRKTIAKLSTQTETETETSSSSRGPSAGAQPNTNGAQPEEEANAVLTATRAPIGQTDRDTLVPLVRTALNNGWLQADLIRHLSHDLDTARSPAAVLRHRLTGGLPERPAAPTPRPLLPLSEARHILANPDQYSQADYLRAMDASRGITA